MQHYSFKVNGIKGLDKYNYIMTNLYEVNVSQNREYRRIFSGYYIPGNISNKLKDAMFSFLENHKKDNMPPTYREVLSCLYDETGTIQYSFASKILHTINPHTPILDKNIMRMMGFELMQSGKPQDRIDYYCNAYDIIADEYREYEDAAFVKHAILRFDAYYPEYKGISYEKKIDCIIFELNDGRAPGLLNYMDRQ